MLWSYNTHPNPNTIYAIESIQLEHTTLGIELNYTLFAEGSREIDLIFKREDKLPNALHSTLEAYRINPSAFCQTVSPCAQNRFYLLDESSLTSHARCLGFIKNYLINLEQSNLDKLSLQRYFSYLKSKTQLPPREIADPPLLLSLQETTLKHMNQFFQNSNSDIRNSAIDSLPLPQRLRDAVQESFIRLNG